jgi:flagellar protein FlaI
MSSPSKDDEKRRAEELRDAERKAKKEAEAKRKEEEERRRAEQRAKKEAEKRAREEAERKRRAEEALARQVQEEKKVAEEKAKREAELKRRQEAEQRAAQERAQKEIDRKAREEAEAKRRLDEEIRRKAELARREAEKKAREEAEQRKREERARALAAERARIEAERAAKEAEVRRLREEEARRREELAKAKQQEAQKRLDEEKARREAEQMRRQEEAAKREAERAAREAAAKRLKEEEEKRAREELLRKDAERRAKELAEQKRREDEQRAKAQERAAAEAAKEARRREEEQRREMERRAREEARVRKLQERAAVGKVLDGGGKLGPVTSGASLREMSDEENRRRQEISKVLSKVNVRFPQTGTPIPPAWRTIEKYPVNSPFAYSIIAQSPLGANRYFLDEVPLTKIEAGIYSYLLDALEDELTVPRTEVNPRQFFAEQARKILRKYSIIVPSTSWAKIIYFAERDLVGFGVIDGLMRDPNIEDISIDAVGKPLFVYHKGHESLETNIVLNDDDALDNLVTRLSHMAGKHVSTAFPIVQGTLPGRHRLVATFRREVSPQGSSATIRKFREDPLTIIDMLNLGVLDHKMAAYIWLMMQNRSTGIVVGATGAGKTTLLNALITLTRLSAKVVTIEEVQEINISHLNWTSLVSRESYAATEEKAGAVDLFELVKAAMRMRPDILVVGEVRGEEAYVLFQAISTGHGGICTLHADDTASALQRLTSEPMNVPSAFIPFLDLSFVVRRLSVPTPTGGFRSIRRLISIDEVVGEHETNQVFRYEPNTDSFNAIPLEKSFKVQNLASEQGVPVSKIIDEIERRTVVLKWLQMKGIRNFREISPILELFASKSDETYNRAVSELKGIGAPVPTERGDLPQ